MSARVLFVELEPFLTRQSYDAVSNLTSERLPWGASALGQLGAHEFDVLVAVAPNEGALSEQIFREILAAPVSKPVVAVLPPDRRLLNMAIPVVDDFVIAPIRIDELQHRIARLLGNAFEQDDKTAAHERLTRDLGLAGLIGDHPAFLSTVKQVPILARNPTPVLITGETGTGKEMFARAIHHLSGRRTLPFIPVDCAALPENLFESELFGHVRGAFTDAHRDQPGLIALAGAGTLFLDEIDALSVQAQSKLLRFLQERTYRPVGSDQFQRADLKIIAASNQDIDGLARDNKFRSDLYFRLNVLRLHLTPLRERRSDIALLVRHFLTALATEIRSTRKTLSPMALQHLLRQDWPGNVRELYNAVQRAVAMCETDQIQPVHLGGPSALNSLTTSDLRPYREARASVLEAFDRGYIEDMLRKAGGNVTEAARLANKDRRVFGRMMKRYNILRDFA